MTQGKVVYRRIEKALQQANSKLPSFEQIKKFSILDHDFKVGEQITPTLKVKRDVCSQLYQDEIEKLYH